MQGPAARYLQNVELQQEMDKTARNVVKQERQIEALESQVGVINPAGLAKSKVVSINTTESYITSFIQTSSCFIPDVESTS